MKNKLSDFKPYNVRIRLQRKNLKIAEQKENLRRLEKEVKKNHTLLLLKILKVEHIITKRNARLCKIRMCTSFQKRKKINLTQLTNLIQLINVAHLCSPCT